MKDICFLCCLMLAHAASWSQAPIVTPYEPSSSQPFGLPNPAAPEQLADFAPMIGMCTCKSVSRNADGGWQDTLQMIWKFKYILNGTAIQDEVWREQEMYAGSIRQFHPDSAKWVVTYFSYPAVSASPGVWLGQKEEETIILKKAQQAPNGMEGFSRLSFFDIQESGFNWKGEWVSTDGTVEYPFWNIFCKKH